MIHCFNTTNALVDKLSISFLHYIVSEGSSGRQLNIALSGGKTPKVLFDKIALKQQKTDKPVYWKNIHFFMVDERCVPPDHADSNYGMIHGALLGKIDLPACNIHRIRGEDDPEREAYRYEQEIHEQVPGKKGIPVFDWIFLGTGEDGHTASIFPDRTDLLASANIVEAVEHPVTRQPRITLTGKPIIQAKKITFLVTGESKSLIVRQIINQEPDAAHFPAAYINARRNDTEWYLDTAAAKYL